MVLKLFGDRELMNPFLFLLSGLSRPDSGVWRSGNWVATRGLRNTAVRHIHVGTFERSDGSDQSLLLFKVIATVTTNF